MPLFILKLRQAQQSKFAYTSPLSQATIKNIMSDKDRIELNEEELRQKINLETGQLTWTELQKYYAKGNVIIVNPGLDLIDAAAKFAEDDKAVVQNWIQSEKIKRALDEDAIQWNERKSSFWTVVVAPWVLVQEIIKH